MNSTCWTLCKRRLISLIRKVLRLVSRPAAARASRAARVTQALAHLCSNLVRSTGAISSRAIYSTVHMHPRIP